MTTTSHDRSPTRASHWPTTYDRFTTLKTSHRQPPTTRPSVMTRLHATRRKQPAWKRRWSRDTSSTARCTCSALASTVAVLYNKQQQHCRCEKNPVFVELYLWVSVHKLSSCHKPRPQIDTQTETNSAIYRQIFQ